jgi:hypothetical protein
MKHALTIVLALSLVGCKDKAADKAGVSGGGGGGKDRTKVAELQVKKLAFEAYPTWAASHPDKACPDKPEDLLVDVPGASLKDPWGHDVKIFCGPNLPAGAIGLAVQSAGPDGTPETADDIQSWK